MSKLRRFRAVSLLPLLGLLLVAPGCLSSQRIETTRPAGSLLSPKLSPFVYFEDGAVVFLGVDTRAARYVKEGTVFPLGLGLANQSMTPLSIGRESFVLESSDGKRYPLVSVEEFNRDYRRSTTDQRLASEFTGVLSARFRNYSRVSHAFFPDRGGIETARDRFDLARVAWTQFYLYFPIPEAGIHGKTFSLLVTPTEPKETFVVRFAVP